jgi:hypothetical protein
VTLIHSASGVSISFRITDADVRLSRLRTSNRSRFRIRNRLIYCRTLLRHAPYQTSCNPLI